MTEPRQVTYGDLKAWWPTPDKTSHKYTRGVVGIDAGSVTYPGAGLLAVAGALGAGPGMVRYLGGAPRELILGRYPSVVTAPGRVQAMVIGSGWGGLVDATVRLDQAVSLGAPLVIDADALNLLPRDLPDGCLITPHAGELARLMGDDRAYIEAHPVAAAIEAAAKLRVTVLLKGATQPVATPDGRVYLALPGPAWTAQAGSGDVLAGACGTLLAAGLPAWQAAVMAASLQAVTARRFPGPYTPDVQASRFPDVVWEVTQPAASAESPG